MSIEANKKRIEVSNAYASGQNHVTFEVTGIGADEISAIMLKQTEFTLRKDDGTVVEEYKHMAFVSASNIPDEEGNDTMVVVTFRKKTEIEIRLDALEEGQETQDGAIEELASIVGGE